TPASYCTYDDYHRATMILLVTGYLVLDLPSCYDGNHRGAMAADFSY
ncbi:hypothetical protein A2U01_0072420, partial [Trifolium medium]|nr:hypothetical protein [Trifolium medium]